MSIFPSVFAVYERLASSKMNSLRDAINAHTHDGAYGVKLSFSNIDGVLSASQILAGTLTGSHLANLTITGSNIANKTLDVTKIDNNVLNANSLKVDNSGYAYYAP
jgi:hypothetical protein